MVTQTPQKRVLFARYLKTVGLGVFVATALLCSFFYTTFKPAVATAATSSTINFQARLMNISGSIVPDGNYNIEFKLYDALSGGTNLWTEDYTSTSGPGSSDVRVRVANGYLSVPLGSITAFSGSIDWSQDLYLTMNIGGTGTGSFPGIGDGAMSPRIHLTAVPYAFKAGQAAQLASGNSTLSFTNPSNSNTIALPDASGTICLQSSSACGFAPGTSASYIQNGTSLQNANFAIQSNASAGSITALIKQASGQTGDLLQIQDSAGAEMFGVNQFGQGYLVGAMYFNNVVGIGQAASSSQQLRILANSTSTVGLTVNAGNVGQTADVLQAYGPSGRALVYNAAGTLMITDGSGQSADLLQFQNSSAVAVGRIDSAGNAYVAGSLDTQTGTGLTLGASNATSLTLAKSGVTTTVAGGTIFTPSSGYSSGSSSTITASLLTNNTVVPVTATAGSLTFTMPTTSIGSAGRVVYITNAGSNAFLLNVGPYTVNMTTSSTITLYWNGTAWSSAGLDAGVTAIGTLDGQSATANGATILNNSLYLQSATASFAGLVNTTTQTFAGAKTFNALITGGAGATISGGAISLTGNAASSLTTGSGALTLTSAAAATWSTSAGSLTLQGAGGVTVTSAAGTTSSAVTVQSGNASSGAAGNVTIDTGTFTSGTPTVNIGSANAAAVQIGNNSSNPTITISSGTSTINVGSGAQARTINIGTGGAVQTIHVGDSSAANVLTIGSTTGAASTTIQGGTGNINILTNSASAGTIIKTNTNSATALQIQNTSGNEIFTVDTSTPQVVLGKASSVTGTLVVKNSTNSNAVTLQSGTTSSSYTLTLPTALGSSGDCLKQSNGTGALAFTSCGAANGTLQGAYSASTGGTTPEIKLDSTRGALDIQDADTTINGGLLTVRASNGSGLGTSLFSVDSSGKTSINSNSTTALLVQNGNNTFDVDTTNSRVGIGTNAPSRTLDVAVNNAQIAAPMALLEQAGSGDASLELKTSSTATSIYVGQDASNSGAFVINSSTAANSSSISHVQGNTNSNDSGGTATIAAAFGSNVGTGHLIVAGASWGLGTGTLTCSDSLGSSFTTQVVRNDSLSSQSFAVCYAITASSGADTVTATFTGGNCQFRRIVIDEYSGIATSSPVDTSAISAVSTTSTSTDAVTSGNITTSQAGDLIYGGLNVTGGSTSITAGTGYTSRGTVSSNDVNAEDKVQVSAGTTSATWSVTNSGFNYIAAAIAFKADAGAGITDTFNNSIFTLSQTGSLTLKNSTNSTTAFQVQSTGGTGLLTADTTNARIQVGSSTTDTTAILFLLDSYNQSSDPTGVNGAMYYNTSMNAFRCYENGAWYNCLTHHIVTLGSDVTNNNASACTIADVTGLSFAVTSGVTYRYHAHILYTAAATTTGSRWAINGPASPTLSAYVSTNALTAGTNVNGNTATQAASAYDAAACSASSATTAGNIATIDGVIKPSANGTVIVRFASEVSSSAIVAKAGSTLEWW